MKIRFLLLVTLLLVLFYLHTCSGRVPHDAGRWRNIERGHFKLRQKNRFGDNYRSGILADGGSNLGSCQISASPPAPIPKRKKSVDLLANKTKKLKLGPNKNCRDNTDKSALRPELKLTTGLENDDRVKRMESTLTKKHVGTGSKTEQHTRDYLETLTGEQTGNKIYDAGHILARQLGGSATDGKNMYQNIVPMHLSINRHVFNPFEGRVRKLAELCDGTNCEVEYNVQIFYFEDLTQQEKASVKNNAANLCGSRRCVPCKFKASYKRIVKNGSSRIKAESDKITFYNFPLDEQPSQQSVQDKIHSTQSYSNPRYEKCH